MIEATPGREPVQIVEIRQPLCGLTFGVSPCSAVAAAPGLKCYNTRGTCGDADSFELGDPLSLYFSRGHVADASVLGVDYVIPSLVSVSTSPTRINLAASNPDATGLGNRAVCNITFQDHQHTDRIVDPYLSDRTWNPLDPDRGSFWSRWIVRNKHRQNVEIIVYEGYAGQALADMVTRTYFLQSITQPDASGRVVIQGKDVLVRLEERKSQAPLASPGVLFADIDETATSLTVAGAVFSDYAFDGFFGTIRIGNEVMTYNSRSISADGIVLSGITRGQDGTIAESHSFDDTVQLCLRFIDAPIQTVLFQLLRVYGGIPVRYLGLSNWIDEVSSYLSLYQINALITEPTAVAQLVSELQIACMFYVWWDERDARVRMRAVRGVEDEPPTITEENHIIAGSFSIAEKPRERASQVWVYYNQRDVAGDLEDEANYNNLFVVADTESETDEEYGEPSIRKIFVRWYTSAALAQTTASAVITRYVDIPSACMFRMDAKDRQYWVGDSFFISHHLDVDQYGQRRLRQWTVTSAQEVVPGEIVEYVCEDTTLYGRIYFIQEAGAADYPGADLADFNAAYIGGADGLLSDGTPCTRIA